MSRTIKSVLFGLLLCAGLLSCEKEYSVENGNGGSVSSGTAVYTFDGAPGACTLPVINGTYQVGTAMAAGNNIILTVNVITPGTYTISTGSVNGVTFSASSSFAQAGSAIIQLAASGTPTAAGPFNYTPGANGCAFSITFAGTSGGGVSTGTSNYTCTSINATGTYTAGTTLGTSNTLELKVTATVPGTYNITTGNVDGFGFSGTGTLAVGNQTIILAPNGTPSYPSIVSFTISTGCAVDIPVAAATGGTDTDFLKATIDGQATRFNTLLAGRIHNVAAGPSELDFHGFMNSTGQDELSFNVIHNTGLINTVTYKHIWANTDKFVEVNYVDNVGSLFVPNLDDINAFSITLSTLTATGATGTFSGTLTLLLPNFGGLGTATKTITNGSFSVTF